MRHALKRIPGLIFHNFGWKLLSLAIAFVIWALVASEPELATFTTVHVEYKNMPDDLEITSEPVETVVLELRGPSGELRADAPRPAVILDLGGVPRGQCRFTIGDGNVRLAHGVHLVRAIPPTVSLKLEPRKQGCLPWRTLQRAASRLASTILVSTLPLSVSCTSFVPATPGVAVVNEYY